MKLKATVRDPKGSIQSYEFDKRSISIGRESRCDIVLKDRAVSASHASLTLNPQAGVYELIDLGSTNGTFQDGKRLIRSIAIDCPMIFTISEWSLFLCPLGEEVQGTIVLDPKQAEGLLKEAMRSSEKMMAPAEVRSPAPVEEKAVPPAPPVSESMDLGSTRLSRVIKRPDGGGRPQLTLEFLTGQYAGKTRQIDLRPDGICFGRDAACDVAFADPHISRNHFMICLDQGEVYIAFLKDGNPVMVDQTTMTAESAWLNNGSIVTCHAETFRATWPDPGKDEQQKPAAARGGEPPAGELRIDEGMAVSGIRRYRLRGDLNANSYYRMENLLLSGLDSLHKWAIVDLEGVRTMDYTALASLIKVLSEHTKINGILLFVQVPDHLVEIFQLVNVERYLRKFMAPTEEAALQRIAQSRKA